MKTNATQKETMHVVKMFPGGKEIRDLTRYQVSAFQNADTAIMKTRNAPKEAEKLIDGGSVYWVFGSQILARQRIIDIRTTQEPKACFFLLDKEIIPVQPTPKRAFQGWRYAKGDEVPPDLITKGREGEKELPAELAKVLQDIGLF